MILEKVFYRKTKLESENASQASSTDSEKQLEEDLSH